VTRSDRIVTVFALIMVRMREHRREPERRANKRRVD
jgi:hypothetical protein